MIYNEKITKIKQKITSFNIFMNDVFVIKILKNFNSNFHTFLAIKNNEIRIQKKLSQYEKFMQHLKEKKNRFKQKKIIDMICVDQNINDENNKNDRKNRNIRKDFDDRNREKNDKKIILMIFLIKIRIVQTITSIIRQTKNIVFILI